MKQKLNIEILKNIIGMRLELNNNAEIVVFTVEEYIAEDFKKN